MLTAVFAIPGDLDTPTGGYRYDREVIAHAPGHGVRLVPLGLPGAFPNPGEADLAVTARALESVPADRPLLIDGLAFGALPVALVARIAAPIVALVHHPLALETGVALDRAAVLQRMETEALAHAAAIVVTSETTRDTLVSAFAVDERRVTIAAPGTDVAPRFRGSGGPGVHMLAVGAVSARKGYDVLLKALASMKGAPWHLTIAGATDRSPDVTASLRDLIMAHGLRERVTLAGNVSPDELDRLYDRSDLFVMASHYEGFGMVLTEAMARGLPLVTTTGGASVRTVPDAAALKVPSGSVCALGEALSQAISDESLRGTLAEASWRHGQQLSRWTETAARVCSVIKRVSRPVRG